MSSEFITVARWDRPNRPNWIMFWPQRFDEIVSNLTCHRFAFLKTAPGIWNTYTILHHMKAYDYCVEKQSLKFQTLSGGGAEKPNIRIGAWLFNFSYQLFISYQNYCRFDKNSTLYRVCGTGIWEMGILIFRYCRMLL